MGSITEIIIGSTESITKQTDMFKNGKRVVKITRVSDGEILTFTSGHAYSSAQILNVFNVSRHFTGVTGSGTVNTPIPTPFGTITIAPATGLSNGDVVTLTMAYTGGNSGPATISYTIPAGTLKQPTHTTPAFTGSFVSNAPGDFPLGTAAQKEAEYKAITTIVKNNEFAGQWRLASVILPHVVTVGYRAFMNGQMRVVELPEAVTIESGAFLNAEPTRLDLPKVVTIGSGAFSNAPLTYLNIPLAIHVAAGSFKTMVNAPTTHVIMKSKFNTVRLKNEIFGTGKAFAGNGWDKISFTWV